MEIKSCPVCNISLDPSMVYENFLNDTFTIECPRCKKYTISDTCLIAQDVKDQLKTNSWALSGLLRYSNEHNHENITIISTSIPILLESDLIPGQKDIRTKCKLLISYIKENTPTIGSRVNLSIKKDISLAFANDIEEFLALIDILVEDKLLEIKEKTLDTFEVALTAKGFKDIDTTEARDDLQKVFIANWFDDNQKDAIAVIEAAVKESGYEPMCIRDKNYAETIMQKGLSEISSSKFVIVNLTGMRDAVIYEAGYAAGAGVEFFFVKDKNDKEPQNEFYTGHYKISFYNGNDELKALILKIISERFAQ